MMRVQEEKKLTMEDVAKELGVSKTTVSRAVSGKGRIGEETRKRVLEYIEQHNYKPNQAAGEPVHNRTYNIGMVLQTDMLTSELPFFPKALKGIGETAEKEEYNVIMTLVDSNDFSGLVRVIENHKVDGMILMRTLQDDQPAAMLKKSGIPFVTIGLSDDPQIYQVDNDHVDACRELTSILLLKGMKKIAVVSGDRNHVINRKRLEGFYQAHQDMGIPYDASLIFTDIDSEAFACGAAERILQRSADCMIGADDLLTGYLLKKLEEENVRIPEEMRLASFHDSQLLKSAKNGITAIKFNIEELGREACKVLLRRMRGEEAAHITKLSYEVAMRESTKW
ncbi:HTH-type transcriptional regulator MalR [Eubacterium plexicaudatum ASF492]|uniref:Uncharacterized protein n=1 Tax=Eubacterium plexicaudatum ASF492 TaxID=1235802 RepID=N2ACQ0_9FIRM|nr:HTH-type transcriptional regulator MalR [Eubacterium plexicaudatum ASF492]